MTLRKLAASYRHTQSMLGVRRIAADVQGERSRSHPLLCPRKNRRRPHDLQF